MKSNATSQSFKYVFNKEKANVVDIKKQFQRLFADPTQAQILFNINQNYFNNIVLPDNTPINTWQKLQGFATDSINEQLFFNRVLSFVSTF